MNEKVAKDFFQLVEIHACFLESQDLQATVITFIYSFGELNGRYFVFFSFFPFIFFHTL